MNGLERMNKFLAGEKVDRPPFIPLAIDWVARQEGLSQEEFVYDPMKRAHAYIDICDKYEFDAILPDSDFFEQLEDMGVKPVLGDSGYHADPVLEEPEDVENLPQPTFAPGTRMGNRIETIKEIVKERGDQKFIFGTCIDAFTEYCNARGLEDAMCELMEDDEETMEGIRFFQEVGLKFIKAQMEAGANGIQIVAPNCSLVSGALYKDLLAPLHKEMVELIQSYGGKSRLHICGDTLHIMPYSLGTGTDILDIDYQVDLDKAYELLGPNQYFCGNLNPAGDLLQGAPEDFDAKVRNIYDKTHNRTIISGGCDVPEATPVENMIAFQKAVVALGE